MRFLWVLKDDAHFDDAKLARHGVTGVCVDPRDKWCTKENMRATRARGLQVGIYTAWNWGDAPADPAGYANWTADFVDDLRIDNNTPRVQFDFEGHDPAYAQEMIQTFRARYRWQALSWTLEGMQGGWLGASLVTTIKSLNVRAVPQCYPGAMDRPWDTAACCYDLIRAGLPWQQVTPMADARFLPDRFDGYIYHQGRLP